MYTYIHYGNSFWFTWTCLKKKEDEKGGTHVSYNGFRVCDFRCRLWDKSDYPARVNGLI